MLAEGSHGAPPPSDNDSERGCARGGCAARNTGVTRARGLLLSTVEKRGWMVGKRRRARARAPWAERARPAERHGLRLHGERCGDLNVSQPCNKAGTQIWVGAWRVATLNGPLVALLTQRRRSDAAATAPPPACESDRCICADQI